MADVFITPASGKIEFKDGSNNTDAVIELLGSGDLSITSPAGGIQLGDTTSDVYIGDGVSNVDIVFEQNGSIRALSGQTLTLGAAGSNLSIASTITGGATITGQLVASYGDAFSGITAANSIVVGVEGSQGGKIKFSSINVNSSGYIQQTNSNMHIDTTNGLYLNYYDGNFVAFGTGASGIAAVMGPDGDLWKGSSDNSGTQYVYNSGTWGISITGNSATTTKLATARTINGTSFDGSANITTANWGTARTLTIGSTGKSVNGSANVSWSLSEIGVNNSTLTLSTSGIATGSQTWTSNQGSNATFTVNVPATNLSVTAGTTAGPTINSSTGTNVVIPSASATASGVVTTGTQTFAGAKTFSSTISGSVSGNAGTATKLATPITINGTSFDGSANITITANTTNTLTRGSYLTGSNFNGSAATTWAVDATTTASNSKIVARDSSGKIRYKNQTDRFSTTTAQTLTNNTWDNKITWTTSIGDGPATHSSGVISVSVAGYYLVTTSVEFLSQVLPLGLRAVRIYKNTTPLVQQTLVADVATTAPPFLAVSDVVYLNGTTDTVAIHAYQSQGSAINTGTTVGSSVTITYLGD